MLVFLMCAVILAPNNDLRRAHNLYRGLEYKAALPPLLDALKTPNLSDEERREALALAGRLHAVLKKPLRARAYFIKLLRLDTTFTVSEDESPYIQKAYSEAHAIVTRENEAKAIASTGSTGPDTGSTSSSTINITGSGTDAGTSLDPANRDPDNQPFVHELPGDDPADDGDFPWWVVAVSAGAAAITAAAILIAQPWHDDPGPPSLGRWELP